MREDATVYRATVGWESVLDKAPQGHVAVPLADAGDGTGGSPDSFATVALTAAGGPGLPSAPAALKLTLSLSGPGGPVDVTVATKWISPPASSSVRARILPPHRSHTSTR